MEFKDLRIYNKKFELISILPKYLGVNWELKFSEFGIGEIELERTDETVKLFTENKYLFLSQGDVQALVTGVKIGETVTVFLRTLEWILTKFIVHEFSVKELEKTMGTFTKSRLLEYILTNNLHPDFNITFCGLENDEGNVEEFALERADNVYSVVKKILPDVRDGFSFTYDKKSKSFIFTVLKAQENNDLILSDAYKTSYETEYNFDIQKELSGAIYYHSVKNMGRWDAETNTPTLSEVPENYGKYYTVSKEGRCFGTSFYEGDVIICKDKYGKFSREEKAEPFKVEIPTEDNGFFSWSGVLSADNSEDAKVEMAENKNLDMITCQTKLSYPEDFSLGDIVLVKIFADEFLSSKKKLVTEVHLWDEPEGQGAMPTIIDIS